MRNKKGTFDMKKKVTSLALAAVMLAGTAAPAYAATSRFTFTRSGNAYGIETRATNFPGYVTAWAKVTDKSNGGVTYRSNRAYKATSASAVRVIKKTSNVLRSGGTY